MCVEVVGEGSSECFPLGYECSPQTHADCVDSMCVSVVGPGGDICTMNSECGSDCGNGILEYQEECDLGTVRNSLSGFGCSPVCNYSISDTPCLMGMKLCSDGNCCLNCEACDEGITCNYDTICDIGIEGCSCPDCDGEVDSCDISSGTLLCNQFDGSCCSSASDGVCDYYCVFIDPDCKSQPGLDRFLIGTCFYTENGGDNCDDGVLVRSLDALWVWNNENSFSSNPDGQDYREDPAGVFRYDPLDALGISESAGCAKVQDTLVCPASVEVPFFGIYSFVGVIVLVVLIYIIYSLKKKNNQNNSKKKKGKKK
jgi:hypothetical protein